MYDQGVSSLAKNCKIGFVGSPSSKVIKVGPFF